MDLKIPFIQNLVNKLENNNYKIDDKILEELENNIKKIIINKIQNSDDNNSQYISDLQLSYFIILFSKMIPNKKKEINLNNMKLVSSIKLIESIIYNDENLLKIKSILDNLVDIFKIKKNNFLNFFYNFQNNNNNISKDNFEIHKNMLLYLIKIKDFDFINEYLKIFKLNNVIEYINGGVPFDNNEENYKHLILDFMINVKKFGNYNWIKWIENNNKFKSNDNDLINLLKILFRNDFDEIKNKLFYNNKMNFFDSIFYKLNSYFNKIVIYKYINIRKNNDKLVEYYLEDYKIIEYFENLNNKEILKKLFNEFDENDTLYDILIDFKEKNQNNNYFEMKFFELFNIIENSDKHFFFDFFLNLINKNYNFDSIKIFLDSLVKENLEPILILKLMNGFSNELDNKYQLNIINSLIDNKNIEKESLNEFINNYYKSNELKEIYFKNNKIVTSLNYSKNSQKILNNIFNEEKLFKELDSCNYYGFYRNFQIYSKNKILKKDDDLIKEFTNIYDFFDLLNENNLLNSFQKIEKKIKINVNKLLLLKIFENFNNFSKNSFNMNNKKLLLNINSQINLNLKLNYFILNLLEFYEEELDNKLLIHIFNYIDYYHKIYDNYPDYFKNDENIIKQNNYFTVIINKII